MPFKLSNSEVLNGGLCILKLRHAFRKVKLLINYCLFLNDILLGSYKIVLPLILIANSSNRSIGKMQGCNYGTTLIYVIKFGSPGLMTNVGQLGIACIKQGISMVGGSSGALQCKRIGQHCTEHGKISWLA